MDNFLETKKLVYSMRITETDRDNIRELARCLHMRSPADAVRLVVEETVKAIREQTEPAAREG